MLDRPRITFTSILVAMALVLVSSVDHPVQGQSLGVPGAGRPGAPRAGAGAIGAPQRSMVARPGGPRITGSTRSGLGVRSAMPSQLTPGNFTSSGLARRAQRTRAPNSVNGAKQQAIQVPGLRR